MVTLLLTTSIRSFAHSDVSVQYWIEPTLIVDPWSTLQAEQNLIRFMTRDCTEVGGVGRSCTAFHGEFHVRMLHTLTANFRHARQD